MSVSWRSGRNVALLEKWRQLIGHQDITLAKLIQMAVKFRPDPTARPRPSRIWLTTSTNLHGAGLHGFFSGISKDAWSTGTAAPKRPGRPRNVIWTWR